MKTFREYISEGQVEQEHIKRVMGLIHPSKRAFARKTYEKAKSNGSTHAHAISMMRLHVEDVGLLEKFDTLMEEMIK